MALRWGILGASAIAKDFMLAMATLPLGEHKVVAIGSNSRSRAKSFADENGVPNAYGSYEEVVKRDDVQVVYVAGYNASHTACSKLALNHGKHVLCEKPFAMNLRQAKEVLELAKEKKLFIMEGIWTRFFPAYLHLQSELKKKVVGDVKIVMANFGIQYDEVRKSQDLTLGGSALLDIGLYTVHFADIVFDGERPESIHASGHLYDGGITDRTVSVTMLYSNKRIAQLLCSAGSALPNVASIIGTKGTISLGPPFNCTTKITSPDGPKDFPLPATREPTHFPNSSGLRYEIDAVRKSITNGELENKRMPHAKTIRIMEYLDEIRRQVGVKVDQNA